MYVDGLVILFVKVISSLRNNFMQICVTNDHEYIPLEKGG